MGQSRQYFYREISYLERKEAARATIINFGEIKSPKTRPTNATKHKAKANVDINKFVFDFKKQSKRGEFSVGW